MRRLLPVLPPAWPPSYPRHVSVSGEVSRALDSKAETAFGVPSFVLMEHASVGVAALASLLAGHDGPIVVVCGPGNNGGDGYGAARFLASWGREVRVLRASRKLPGGPDAAREVALAGAVLELEDAWATPALVAEALANANVAVDALFGVGLDRDLDEPFPNWIRALNEADCLRLAVDVPSGLDADTGLVRPLAVRADVTATMAMPKVGMGLGDGLTHVGRVVEVDIGLPGALHRQYVA